VTFLRTWYCSGGPNRKNLAHIRLEPRRDFAAVLVTNIKA
jgi:hypothetical protein